MYKRQAYNKFNDDGNLPQGATEKYYGEIKLFLQNGAIWNNEAWGAVEKKAFAGKKYDGSHLTCLLYTSFPYYFYSGNFDLPRFFDK